jgi:hexokinase
MLTKMETNQEIMDANLEAHHERMMNRMGFQLEKMESVVDVFKKRSNKMDTTDSEAN